MGVFALEATHLLKVLFNKAFKQMDMVDGLSEEERYQFLIIYYKLV